MVGQVSPDDAVELVSLNVAAEGVKTLEQHDAIATLGCDLAQGYLYARPMDATAIGELITTQTSNAKVPAG